MSPGAASDNEPCVWLLAEGAIRYLQASAAEGPDLRNLYQCLVRLARWRATEEFRMSDPDRLTSHDKTFGRDTRLLILRIIVVAFLAALFWHTVIAAGLP
jgi:hypothetical protein